MPYKNLNSEERRESVKILYSNAISGIAISTVVSFILVFAFDLNNQKISYEKSIWLSIMVILLAARAIDVMWFYKTKKNLPWAIEVFTTNGDFRHPLSKVSILDAYPLFGAWAETNQYKDWYAKPTFGKIYNN